MLQSVLHFLNVNVIGRKFALEKLIVKYLLERVTGNETGLLRIILFSFHCTIVELLTPVVQQFQNIQQNSFCTTFWTYSYIHYPKYEYFLLNYKELELPAVFSFENSCLFFYLPKPYYFYLFLMWSAVNDIFTAQGDQNKTITKVCKTAHTR